MGWAYVGVLDDGVRPSLRYQGCYYCPRCEATYSPNLEWGFPSYDRHDTSGACEWSGVHRKGDECPRCGREPVERLTQ